MTKRQQNLGVLIIALTPLMTWMNHPSHLLGHQGAEVYGNAWSWWWRTESWPFILQGTDLAIGVSNFPAVDIFPLILLGWIVERELMNRI